MGVRGLSKRSDWRNRLNAYVEAQRRGGFAFGARDCALFVAGAVEAMTGIDYAAEYRGRYNTLQGGLHRVRASGYLDHIDMVASLFKEIPRMQAKVGDIAVIDGEDGGLALGVVGGSRIFVRHKAGLSTVDLTVIKRAFEI